MRSAIRKQSAMPWCSGISIDCFISDWDSRGISFVVRLRKDIKFIRKAAFSQSDDREQDILVDEAVELVGDETSKNYPHPLRRVVVYRPYDSSRRKAGQTADDTEAPEHTIELITNNAYWEADTISALYKFRWQIESFFKTYKTAFAHQDLYRNKQECRDVSDLDGHDSHIAAPIPQKQGKVRLAYVQSCHIHQNPSDELH